MNEFRRTLKAAGVSQAWAARQLGCTAGWLGKILNGKENAGTDLLRDMDSLAERLRGSGLARVS